MNTVWFRCDRKNERMFVLNTKIEMNNVPVIGDIISTVNEDFMKASFRVKPWFNSDERQDLKNAICLDFKVVSRKYSIRFDEWELKCEPTPESLLFLLQSIKTKK